MRLIFCTVLFSNVIATCHAQYFQFSQYNFTPQRTNPALVAGSNYATLSFDYRKQATDGGFHLSSNILNASYPLIAGNGRRWAGVGISLMDDRSGQSGIFNTKEAALSYAANVPLSRWQNLSLGVKALYQSRRINLDGLYTGSQFIADRGFDRSVFSGEAHSLLRNSFLSFSAGLHWQETDTQGNRMAYWGLSFFDFNKPEDSFLGSTSRLNSTFTGMAGVRIYAQDEVSIFPEMLFTRSAARNVLNMGLVTSYEIRPYPNKVSARLDVLTKYVFGRSGIIGLQVHRDNFSFGFSYDFPVVARNVANTGAFELGLELRRLVDPKKKSRTAKRKPAPKREHQDVSAKKSKKPVTVRSDSLATSVNADSTEKEIPVQEKETLSARLKHKHDSLVTRANAGTVQHEPLVLEKATLHFSFRYNSTDLDAEAARYFNDLALALTENPELRIRLVGHTDNIGSDKFNLKLSLSRAAAIREYLIGKGVAGERIIAEGKGLREPIHDNATEEGRARNRRVEMTILYQE